MPDYKSDGKILWRPTESQARAEERFADADVLFLSGRAGTGKTHTALALAVRHVEVKRLDKIVLCRPAVTAGGEEHGFLPGNIDKKMRPWIQPLHDILPRMTFQPPEKWIAERVEVAPLAYLRGRTFSRCVAILDEAQNCTRGQMLLFLTRMGQDCKLILAGDPSQSDIPASGFLDTAKRLAGIAGITGCTLRDAVNPRHPLIPRITERLTK